MNRNDEIAEQYVENAVNGLNGCGCGSHFQYAGPTIYSYSKAIGHWTGTKFVLWNGRYSPTTSRHQNLVRRAVEKSGYPVEFAEEVI